MGTCNNRGSAVCAAVARAAVPATWAQPASGVWEHEDKWKGSCGTHSHLLCSLHHPHPRPPHPHIYRLIRSNPSPPSLFPFIVWCGVSPLLLLSIIIVIVVVVVASAAAVALSC